LGAEPPAIAMIEISYRAASVLRREGETLHWSCRVASPRRCSGRAFAVPTVTGPVTMTIPKGSDTGAQLRMRGKGIRGGRQGPRWPAISTSRLKFVIGAKAD